MIHLTRPYNFHTDKEIVGCILYDTAHNFLLLKRHPDKPEGGTWGFPGGKVDATESSIGAIVREVREETGLVIAETIPSFGKVYVDKESDNSRFIYHVFGTEISPNSVIQLNPGEHTEYGWFSKSEALRLQLIHDLEACLDIFLP